MTVARFPATPCFWIERTGRVRLGLRRFTFSVGEGQEEDGRHHDCPTGQSGCDASVALDVMVPLRFSDEGDYGKVMAGVPKSREPGRRDKRWPPACSKCGEPFTKDAQWQVFQEIEYRRSDNGELLYMRNYPGRELAGAMLDQFWHLTGSDGKPNVGDDGISLCVVLPDGMPWHVDGEATGGGRWTRTGDPRDPQTLTVAPSILTTNYHGFLRAGILTADIG